MAIEIVHVQKEHFPRARLIGKCYTNDDRDQYGSFAVKWEQWFKEGWFTQLEKIGPLPRIENGYYGLMGCNEDFDSFQYWIGTLFEEGTPVPEGFEYVDLPEGDVGVCWIKGKEETGEIYGEEAHNLAIAKLKENDMAYLREDFKEDTEKWWWFFERYNSPRFTEKQADGTVILDYGVYLK
ncbi:AraC family transcriptional regulator [Amphibacillus cookii]|uniref:AraC family transcriptional regulator n=1 Tax=Amphibacillus cookii TaxID=767787 RepID=UPI0019570C4E|nr:AraC family transcriptional regulator [Amphibacillus cookii]MBM7540114.1 putative transcriptional regulator YdeE [Amphibacillus cookii]